MRNTIEHLIAIIDDSSTDLGSPHAHGGEVKAVHEHKNHDDLRELMDSLISPSTSG